ncbi:UPF0235 protein C15orf40 like, partial [Dissostichus eleginoides]
MLSRTALTVNCSCIRLSKCVQSFQANRLTVLTVRSSSGNRKMPKKGKAVKGQPAAAVQQEAPSSPVTQDKSGAVTVTVHAKPGAKHSDISAEAVGVSIAAPPTDGEANTELIRYLAEVLDLKKSHISLDKGSRSRDKVIRVDSSLNGSPSSVFSSSLFCDFHL